MTDAFTTVSLLVGVLLVYKSVNLFRYVRLAKATGLPYVITPVLETEVVGLMATPFLRWIYHDYLDRGEGWPKWCRLIIKDWQWEDKRRAHDEYGEVFLCVSPEGIICYSADASMGWDVMNRRNDFTKPRDKYKLLEPYGPNVATAEGKTYRFHVRITAPPFGDMSGVNELVWRETVYQTRRLCEAWSQETPRELQMDVNSLTLSVISLAGFGKRVDWTSTAGNKDVPKGYRISFLEAIHNTTSYMVAILLFPGWLLGLSPLKKAHLAHSQLDKYLRQMIRSEKSNIEINSRHESSVAKGNLLTAVLRASASEASTNGKDGSQGGRKQAFTEDEVMGNLFVYLLAGYETTANAITYGLVTLALRGDIQDNVIEEIDAVYAQAASEGRKELTYSDDFEKLQYTYGFMYETFRLYPGVILITKMVHKDEQIYTEEEEGPKSYLLPAGTRVYLNSPAVHYSDKYWPDHKKLDPTRWYDSSATAGRVNKDSTLNDKKIVAADKTRHMRGTLLTFSDGSRACLGRKFAQAEYIAFLAALLKDYRVELAPGSDPKKVERDINFKCAGKVTLAPLDNVKLKLKRR